MKVTEENIAKVLSFIGFNSVGVGRHYLEDMLLERAYYDLNDWRPHYTQMVNDVSRINEVEPNTLRRGIKLYVDKNVNSLSVTIPTNKRVFLAMLASIPIASLVELLYTLMINTGVESYE